MGEMSSNHTFTHMITCDRFSDKPALQSLHTRPHESRTADMKMGVSYYGSAIAGTTPLALRVCVTRFLLKRHLREKVTHLCPVTA